jgi:GT2 family glycosyltransferase
MQGISVIIPTLHRTEFTLDTIKYLVEQQCEIPFEIVIVDQSNAIDENIRKICKEFDFCTYYHIDFFKGLPEARNFGWQKAKYDFILFVDDDIQCDKNLIQQHFNILNQNNVGVVAGGIIEVHKENQECKVGDFNFWTATPLRGFHKQGTFEVLHGGGGNFSTKKEVLLKVNGIDENLTKGAALYEETDFCLRVKKAGFKIMFHSKASVNHLAAETGGCRVDEIQKYIASLVRNRSIIIQRYLNFFQRITANIYLFRLVFAYMISYKNFNLLKQYFKSIREGNNIAKQAVICTKYGK